jgi:hypothetical protein
VGKSDSSYWGRNRAARARTWLDEGLQQCVHGCDGLVGNELAGVAQQHKQLQSFLIHFSLLLLCNQRFFIVLGEAWM